MRRRPAVFRASALLVALAGCLVGCGSSEGNAGRTPGAVTVEASFYPLQWMAEQVGGDHVEVTNLTKAGTEPHDLELTPRDVAALDDADLVAYLSGFQPAVDDAVAGSSATRFDAADSADLDLTFTPIEGGQRNGDEAEATDPHFWLDPTRLAKVADAFAVTLAKQDPKHAADYRANAAALGARLEKLDAAFEAGLRDCANKDLVTAHNAFGYLAKRYGLVQVGITGLTADAEPSAGELADVTEFVTRNDVRTIYFETLVSPAVAKAVASEAGARTDVLDPIEGLNDDSQGSDYLEIMRSNLENLQAGQPCP